SAIPEYGAAGVGLHARAAAREIRIIVYGALAVRGGTTDRRGRRGDHSSDRVSADTGASDSAGPFDRIEAERAKLAAHCEAAERGSAKHCAGQEFAEHAGADEDLVRGTVEDCA